MDHLATEAVHFDPCRCLGRTGQRYFDDEIGRVPIGPTVGNPHGAATLKRDRLPNPAVIQVQAWWAREHLVHPSLLAVRTAAVLGAATGMVDYSHCKLVGR